MKKKNIKYIITYFILVLFFFIGTLFYRQSFLAILLLLELLLPAISMGLTYFVSRNLQFNVLCETSQITCSNTIPITLSINNPTIFPLLNLEVDFEYYNLFYHENKISHSICLSAQPKKITTYTLPFETCYSGMFQFCIHRINVSDLLHMKTFVLPFQKTLEVPILPKTVAIPPIPLPVSNEAAEDSDILQKYGVVSTEFQGVREYIPGDKLQNIHWKMSAKSDDLLVKNPQPVAERLLTIIPEMERSKLEDTVVYFYSFCRQLVQNQEIFLVGVFSHTDKTFQFHQIRNMEQLQETVFQLFYSKVYSGSALARSYYTTQNSQAEFISIYGSQIAYYRGDVPQI